MRLRRIHWKRWATPPDFWYSTCPEWESRHDFKEWLEDNGACVHASLWTWEVRYD